MPGDHGASALIFGATSAIVSATTERLARRKTHLYLVSRSPERLAPIVEALGPSVVGYESIDATDYAAMPAVVERAVAALGGSIDLALIGHGWLPDQQRTEESWEDAHRTFEINLLGTVALLLPVANLMEQQASGHIAVITSVAGERGRPRNYTYGAAKAGLNVYLQGLRSRLYPAGVRVSVLKPGPVHSPMTENHPKNALFASPDQVADGILAALDGDRDVAWLPGYWRPILWTVRLLPERVFQRLPFLSGR